MAKKEGLHDKEHELGSHLTRLSCNYFLPFPLKFKMKGIEQKSCQDFFIKDFSFSLTHLYSRPQLVRLRLDDDDDDNINYQSFEVPNLRLLNRNQYLIPMTTQFTQ